MEIFVLGAVLLLVPVIAVAANDGCGERNEAAQCQPVKYKRLPTDLKKFMGKNKCNVKSGSNYDYGYPMDLNFDGTPEYAFCCRAAPHGPCEMKIFGKISDKWKILLDDMPGYLPDPDVNCGLNILRGNHEGYSDICLKGSLRTNRFSNGKYQEAVK